MPGGLEVVTKACEVVILRPEVVTKRLEVVTKGAEVVTKSALVFSQVIVRSAVRISGPLAEPEKKLPPQKAGIDSRLFA